ncbi:hypothetical protein AVEN_193610-1 [Araneus ventricosus]|uniref:Uncharacterized protein n=1 Tax=Araneus ventricosus TaxID=182803 RepID=A0A4Y2WVI6_ARAVE|nr:hypothetical protein AVEN_193610-1 [Araneus ventricosus]
MPQSALPAASIPPYSSSHPSPPPPLWGFLLFGDSNLPFPPCFLHSDSHAHSPSPTLHPQTGDLSPARRIVFHFYGRNGMNGNPATLEFQTLPQSTQLSSGFHIDERIWHPVSQKKCIGTLVNVPLNSSHSPF